MADPSERNMEMVRRTFEAYAHEGVAVVFPLLDRDVEVYSPPEVANSGLYRGVDGYRAWTDAWFDAWDEFVIEPEDVEAVGETCVIAVCRQRGTGKASGIEVEQTMVYMWDFQDGRIVRFHLYMDRDAAVAAALDPTPKKGPEG
jgi:ketosteroid isomerase-like protein